MELVRVLIRQSRTNLGRDSLIAFRITPRSIHIIYKFARISGQLCCRHYCIGVLLYLVAVPESAADEVKSGPL